MKGCITSRLTISHIKLKKKLRQKKLSMRIHRNMRGENKARARWGFFCCSRYMNGAVCHVDWYHSVRVRRILKITRVHIKLWKSYNPTLFGNRYKISSFFFLKKRCLSLRRRTSQSFLVVISLPLPHRKNSTEKHQICLTPMQQLSGLKASRV